MHTNATSLMTAPSPPRQHLASTQDLLSRLQLVSAYDKYVRSPQNSLDGSLNAKMSIDGGLNSNTLSSGVIPNPMSPHVDKGKGREVPVRGGEVDTHDPNDGDEDDMGGKGEKRKRNNYKHLIKGIPGKLVRCLMDFWTFVVLSCYLYFLLTFLTRETLLEKGRLPRKNDARSSKAKDTDTTV